MSNLLDRINGLFSSVEPNLGITGTAPTGEPYVTYALGYIVGDDDNIGLVKLLLQEALFGIFHFIRYPNAFSKPEGAPIFYERVPVDFHKMKIYWRKHPEVEDSIDFDTGSRRIKITCRALVSSKPKP